MESLITAILTALCTVGLGLPAFEYQQRWNKKIELYEEIITSLSKINENTGFILAITKSDGRFDVQKILKFKYETLVEISRLQKRKFIYRAFLNSEIINSLQNFYKQITPNMQKLDSKIDTYQEIQVLDAPQFNINETCEEIIKTVQSSIDQIDDQIAAELFLKSKLQLKINRAKGFITKWKISNPWMSKKTN